MDWGKSMGKSTWIFQPSRFSQIEKLETWKTIENHHQLSDQWIGANRPETMDFPMKIMGGFLSCFRNQSIDRSSRSQGFYADLSKMGMSQV